jgi:hypothetical protein
VRRAILLNDLFDLCFLLIAEIDAAKCAHPSVMVHAVRMGGRLRLGLSRGLLCVRYNGQSRSKRKRPTKDEWEYLHAILYSWPYDRVVNARLELCDGYYGLGLMATAFTESLACCSNRLKLSKNSCESLRACSS